MLDENKETMETRHPNPWEDAIDTVRVCTIIVYACNSGDGEAGVFCFEYSEKAWSRPLNYVYECGVDDWLRPLRRLTFLTTSVWGKVVGARCARLQGGHETE